LQVSPDEFVAFCRHYRAHIPELASGGSVGAVTAHGCDDFDVAARTLFYSVDLNAGGDVCLEEFRIWARTLGICDENVEQYFQFAGDLDERFELSTCVSDEDSCNFASHPSPVQFRLPPRASSPDLDDLRADADASSTIDEDEFVRFCHQYRAYIPSLMHLKTAEHQQADKLLHQEATQGHIQEVLRRATHPERGSPIVPITLALACYCNTTLARPRRRVGWGGGDWGRWRGPFSWGGAEKVPRQARKFQRHHFSRWHRTKMTVCVPWARAQRAVGALSHRALLLCLLLLR